MTAPIKKLVLLLSILSLSSCDIYYEPETRLILKTNIVDIDGNPVAGISTQVRVSAGGNSDLISSGTTDANGNLTLAFPSARSNNADYSLEFVGNATYERRSFINIPRSMFNDDYTYMANERIDRTADLISLEMDYVQNDPNHLLREVSIEGLVAAGNVNFEDDDDDGGEWSDIDLPSQFSVYKNQVLQLSYTIIDIQTGQSAILTTPVTVGETDTEFTLSY